MTFSCSLSKRRSLVVLLLATLIQPAGSIAVMAQATEEFIGFSQTEFDQIVKKNRFTDHPQELISKLTPFFKALCEKKDLNVLDEANFMCTGRICKTSRTVITTGSLQGNKITQIYNIRVKLLGRYCPSVDVKIESEFTPAK